MKKQMAMAMLAVTAVLASGCGKIYRGQYRGTESLNTMNMVTPTGTNQNGSNSAVLTLNDPDNDQITGTYQSAQSGFCNFQGHLTANAIDSIMLNCQYGSYYGGGYYPQQPSTQPSPTPQAQQADCTKYNGVLLIQDKRIVGLIGLPPQCGGYTRNIDLSRQ